MYHFALPIVKLRATFSSIIKNSISQPPTRANCQLQLILNAFYVFVIAWDLEIRHGANHHREMSNYCCSHLPAHHPSTGSHNRYFHYRHHLISLILLTFQSLAELCLRPMILGSLDSPVRIPSQSIGIPPFPGFPNANYWNSQHDSQLDSGSVIVPSRLLGIPTGPPHHPPTSKE